LGNFYQAHKICRLAFGDLRTVIFCNGVSVYAEHPRIIIILTNPRGQVVFSILTLAAIILFNMFFYIYCPNDGMVVYQENPLGGVSQVYPGGPAEIAGVEVGDRILAIAGKPVAPLRSEPRYPPGLQPGDVIEYELQRGNERTIVSITVGNYLDNLPLLGSYLGIQILSLFLWGVGLVLVLFVQPDDVRARLLGLGFLLAGLTAAVGGASGWNSFWGANTIQQVLLCLLAPLLVAAHLTFPAVSFGRYRRGVINNVFALAGMLALLVMFNDWLRRPLGYDFYEIYGINLRQWVLVFFMLSWGVSVALLLRNRFLSNDPLVRRQTGIIIWGMVLGIGPFFVFTLLPYLLLGEEYLTGTYTILFLICLPLAYAYVVFQHRLLKVDFIINRIVVWFILVLLVFISSVLIFSALVAAFDLPPLLPLYGGLVTVLIALPVTALSKAVQAQVDRVLYGGHYDYATVTSSLANQLAQALDRHRLVELLAQNMPQQMGIQQASLWISDGSRLVYGAGQEESETRSLDDHLCKELLERRSPLRTAQLWSLLPPATQADWAEFDWGEVYAPLIFKEELRGILILGRRAGGEVYSNQDLRIVATVAEQGALAVTNILLVEQLRGLAQQLVRSTEEERKRLARDLHDTVLQELFFIKQGLYREPADPELVDYLEESIQNLRRAIKAQRPPLLDGGLPLALQGLVEEMQKLAGPSLSITWASELDGTLGLSDEQATSVYRIAQEALSNALKHGNARHIEVGLEQATDRSIRLLVSNDGVGAPLTSEGDRQSQGHFGLALMQERALMIGARLHIQAAPEEGTTVVLEVVSFDK